MGPQEQELSHLSEPATPVLNDSAAHKIRNRKQARQSVDDDYIDCAYLLLSDPHARLRNARVALPGATRNMVAQHFLRPGVFSAAYYFAFNDT